MHRLITALMLIAALAILGCAPQVEPQSTPQSEPAASARETPPETSPETPPETSPETSPETGMGETGSPEIPAGPAGTATEDPGDRPLDTTMALSPTHDTDRETTGTFTSDSKSAKTMTDTMESAAAAMPTAGGTRSGPGSGPAHTGVSPDVRREPHSRLKAGEVDDNRRWQEYLDFVQDYSGPIVHETSLKGRQIITVLDQDGKPVPNALVTVRDGRDTIAKSLTYADGRTMFFPGHLTPRGMTMKGGGQDEPEFSITAERDGFTGELDAGLGTGGTSVITLEGTMTYGESIPLDVLFLLDATGSMADEINQIKSTLRSIAHQVSQLPASPDLRFGMVSYRDRGDEYVTRQYPFDSNVRRFQESVQEVRADGGDDYPESLNQALHEAVNDMGWREDAIRLIFLVADAPPHLDYPQDEDYAVDIVRAREAGIKIFAVASSGLDQPPAAWTSRASTSSGRSPSRPWAGSSSSSTSPDPRGASTPPTTWGSSPWTGSTA